MGDIKFSCPRCNQSIECDELWGGHELACPTCQTALTVPQIAPPPAVRAGPVAVPGKFAPRLSIGATKAPQQTAAPPAAPGVGRPGAFRPAPQRAPSSSGAAMKWVKIAAVVVVLAVGGYFGYGFVKSWQGKTNAQMDAATKKSDRGEAGRMATPDTPPA